MKELHEVDYGALYTNEVENPPLKAGRNYLFEVAATSYKEDKRTFGLCLKAVDATGAPTAQGPWINLTPPGVSKDYKAQRAITSAWNAVLRAVGIDVPTMPRYDKETKTFINAGQTLTGGDAKKAQMEASIATGSWIQKFLAQPEEFKNTFKGKRFFAPVVIKVGEDGTEYHNVATYGATAEEPETVAYSDFYE